jgi:hypothetical protein
MLRQLIFLLCLALPLHLLADTVWLSNGDRLSGTIVLLDGGKLVLDTPLAGRVQIDWKGVTTLASDKPLLLRHNDLDKQLEGRLFASTSGTVHLGADAGQRLPLAGISRLLPPTKVLGDFKWQGKLDVKLDLDNDEHDSREWNLKGETRIEHSRWRHVIDGKNVRKEKDQKRTDDNWKLSYDLDYFFTHHWFARTNVLQELDRQGSQEIWREAGTGPGYRFWDNELGRLEFIAQFTRVSLVTKDGQAAFNTLGVGWDFKRTLWGSRIDFTSKGELQIPQISTIDYLFESEYGVSYRLTDWARLSLLYELERYGFGEQTQQNHHYLLGVGVTW